jgi:DMSO/TMAO reductase YedYZ molybdopterin-dependent catalytic subunit
MASFFKRNRVPEGVDPSRIPPGQTLTAPDRWPLLHFGPVPKTDIAKWDFNVFGAVENPLRLDYGELRALPAKDVVADIHCVTGWSRLGDRWTGVPIKDILARVKPKP